MKLVTLLSMTALTAGCVATSDSGEVAAQGVGSDSSAASGSAAPAPTVKPANPAFVKWLDLVKETDPQIGELYYAYYDTSKSSPWFLSTAVSAQVLEYMLATGDTARAEVIADSLLGWQYDGTSAIAARVRGAFPSEIERNASTGEFEAEYLYDTDDNLVICEALLELYDATHQQRYLTAATGIGTWIRDVMVHGETYGVLVTSLGAPMRSVTDQGNFDNTIPVGATLIGLPTLKRLSARTGDASFAKVASSAFAFLRQGQEADGAIDDHYDPGYPAQPFSQSRFVAYEPGAVVADDSIRGAIGLYEGGATAQVGAFLGWLKRGDGGIPGYLDLTNGGGFFPSDTTPYFDVVSSGLYAALATRVANGEATAAQAFENGKQAANGGWFWGAREDNGAQIDSNQATITGLAALMDLSPASL